MEKYNKAVKEQKEIPGSPFYPKGKPLTSSTKEGNYFRFGCSIRRHFFQANKVNRAHPFCVFLERNHPKSNKPNNCPPR
jgi:hypothetical protein